MLETYLQDKFAELGPSTRGSNLIRAYKSATVQGSCLEFGVFRAKSISFLANTFKDEHFYGFDSFVGLPEEWVKGQEVYKKGHFRLKKLPKVPKNVTLVQGFFDKTLPGWLENNPEPVKFLHIDCDLYSSTKYVLEALDSRLLPGTVIVFDELFPLTKECKEGYPKYREGEFKALEEFKKGFEVIGFGDSYQVSIVLLK